MSIDHFANAQFLSVVISHEKPRLGSLPIVNAPSCHTPKEVGQAASQDEAGCPLSHLNRCSRLKSVLQAQIGAGETFRSVE